MSGMIGVTFLAVTKVIVAVLVGAFTCRSIPNTASTIRDFSFLISVVLLPCLTLYNVSMSVTVELLVRCSILLIFSLLMILIGLGCALIISKLLFRIPPGSTGVPVELEPDVRLKLLYHPAGMEEGVGSEKKRGKKGEKGLPYIGVVLSDRLEELGVTGHDIVAALTIPTKAPEEYPGHYWGCLVAMSILNTITLPLGLVQNLATSLSWIQLEEGSAYMFVFSIVSTVHIWAFGPLMVEYAKRQSEKAKLIRHLMEQHHRRQIQCDSSTQTEVLLHSSASPATRGEEREFPTSALPLVPPHGEMEGEAAAGDKGTQVTPTARPPAVYLRPTDVMAETVPYQWEKEGLLKVVYESQMRETEALERRSWDEKCRRSLKQLGLKLGTNMPFMSIVVAVVIGIIPFIRNLFFGGPLEMLMDAVGLIASGNIPSSLLLLGANLVGSSSFAEEYNLYEVRLRHAEQNTNLPLNPGDLALAGEDAAAAEAYNAAHASLEPSTLNDSFSRKELIDEGEAVCAGGGHCVVVDQPSGGGEEKEKSGLRMAFSMDNASKTFVWGMVVSRLVIVPGFTFVVLVLITKTMPFLFGGKGNEDKTLLLVLFAEVAAPTAINSALLYNQAEYMTYEWAKMLFFQYLCCTLSTVMWTSLGLAFVQSL